MIAWVLFLSVFLTTHISQADIGVTTCRPATNCVENTSPDFGSMTTSCQILGTSEGGTQNNWCDITTTNVGGVTETCVRVTNNENPRIFIPAKPNSPDWGEFLLAAITVLVTKGSQGTSCNQATTVCSAAAVGWSNPTNNSIQCAGGLPSGNFNTTRAATDSDEPTLGNATFRCLNGAWTLESGTCTRSCPPATLVWGFVEGAGCSADVSIGANGSSVSVSDSNVPPREGTATFNCVNGTWNATAQTCAASPCAATYRTWTYGSQTCGATIPGVASGSTSSGTDSVQDPSTGTATFSCTAGTFSANPVSLTCTDPITCPSGTSTTGAGGVATPATCRCNSAGTTWCITTLSCTTSCPTGQSSSGLGGPASAGCNCNNSGEVYCGSTMTCGGGCPSGTSTTGAGGSAGGGCFCPLAGYTWNGSSCVSAGGPCTSTYSIYAGPPGYTFEFCTSGTYQVIPSGGTCCAHGGTTCTSSHPNCPP